MTIEGEAPKMSEVLGGVNVFQDYIRFRKIEQLTGEQIVDQFGAEIREGLGANMPDATPVLVCAWNEEGDLPLLLHSLARSPTNLKPVVVDNGSNDRTGEFASYLGAEVIEEPRHGLINALSTGFGYVANELNATEVLHTDADTYPLSTWPDSMLGKVALLSPEEGGQIFGPLSVFGSSSKTQDYFRTLVCVTLDAIYYTKGDARAHGPNGVIAFDEEGKIADALQSELDPLVVTNTDSMVRDTIASNGGHIGYNWSLRALVFFRGDRYPSIREIFKTFFHPENREKLYQDWYLRQTGGYNYETPNKPRIGKY